MGATNSTNEWSQHDSEENKYKNIEQTIPNAIERDHLGGGGELYIKEQILDFIIDFNECQPQKDMESSNFAEMSS